MKSLIVNADDFGLTRGVTDGILRAHREGVVTSTTLMVNMPAAEYAAASARHHPKLGVGVHLNLTAGFPVLPPERIPSLVDREGRFSRNLLRIALRADRWQIYHEWSSQIKKCLELGIAPTHLDSHHYVHSFPVLAEIVISLAKEYGVPAVRRISPRDFNVQGFGQKVKPVNVAYRRFLTLSSRMLAESGLAVPEGALFLTGGRDELIARLRNLPQGNWELITHPGFMDDSLRAVSSLLDRRELEMEILTDPEVKRVMEEEGIRLITFQELRD